MPQTVTTPLTVPLWFLFGGRHLLVGKVMTLMKAIDSEGSITRAAAAVPMSYKTAWDMIDKLNNASARPVVVTATGGRNGGGATLSCHGKTLLSLYASLERSYHTFDDSNVNSTQELQRFLTFMNGVCMKTSARNQLSGIVTGVTAGMVNSRIVINISYDTDIIATITNESVSTLELAEGVNVTAFIKAPSVLLFTDDDNFRTSAENSLRGTVAQIKHGKVNAEVLLALPGNKTIASVVTRENLAKLDITVGRSAKAVFSASQVILALPV